MPARTLTLVFLLPTVAAGCANYLYTGHATGLDTANVEREAVLYWQKTTSPLGAKAGPLVLMTACGRKLFFTESGDPVAVVYRGVPGSDRLPGDDGPLPPGTVCGEVVGEARFVDMTDGPLDVMLRCIPVADDEGFSVVETYLRPRPEPYRFDVEVTRRFRWLGGGMDAPPPPPCDNSTE